ncbi:uncharacterized protein LOC117317990 [Pecten maximus]|uniref:uncharacterized protein LOC117317990 n=1 Tax=Pecten maximus TaxID=6579 RepID=UPI001458E711|nr:uncharacterized protein LOC117317990 [Pecten maximus]
MDSYTRNLRTYCQSNGQSQGKTQHTKCLDSYFRQNSMFRLPDLYDSQDKVSEHNINAFLENSYQDENGGDDLLEPVRISNTCSKSVQTDFSSNEVVLSEYLEEFDPLFVNVKENDEQQSESNHSGMSTLATDDEMESFDFSKEGEDVLVNLNYDSLSDESDCPQYTDSDLQEVLISSEVPLTGSKKTTVNATPLKDLDFEVHSLSERVTSILTTNESLIMNGRLMYHKDDSSDDDEEEFVKVPRNVLKYVHFSNSRAHQQSRGATSCEDCVRSRRWSGREQNMKNEGRKKKQSPPYTLATSFSPSRKPISNILPNEDGSIWITFQNSNIVKLYDYHGNAIDSIDVRMEIDDITSSKDGTLYISCPRARCIKVLTRTMQLHTLLVTPTFVRGIVFSPIDNCLIACLVPDLTNQIGQDCCSHGACVMRYSIQRHCRACPRNTYSGCYHFTRYHMHVNAGSRCSKCICSQDVYCIKWSKVTHENLFKYPFRVAVNSNGDVAVSDHGNRTVLLLSNSGTLLGSFNQSNVRLFINHALAFDVNNDLLIVQSGQRNILRIRRYVDCSTSVTKSTVPEMESQSVTAAAMDSKGMLLVVMDRTLIKVLKKIDIPPLH